MKYHKYCLISLPFFFAVALAAETPIRNKVTVKSVEQLILAAQNDNCDLSIPKGSYIINNSSLSKVVPIKRYSETKPPVDANITTLFHFLGNNSIYNLTGVKICIDTKMQTNFNANNLYEIFISGNNNRIIGVSFEDISDMPACKGSELVVIIGDNNTLHNVTIDNKGSSPYGYEYLLGKGAGAFVKLQKISTLLICSVNTNLIDCKIFSNAYGHAIFMQGAVNTYIQECYVEGKMRPTNEILSENKGFAFDLNFKSNHPLKSIQPQYMVSLSEDGIRTYPYGGLVGRYTGGVTVVNTTVKNMHSGFDMSVNLSPTLLIECTAIGCQEKGYSIGSEGVIVNSKGDALYGPLLTFQRNDVVNCRIDLLLMDTTSSYTINRLCEINETGHKIKLTNYQNKKQNIKIPIVFGESFWSDAHRFRQPTTDPKEFSGAYNVKLINETEMLIVFTELSSGNIVRDNSKLVETKEKNNHFFQY